MVDALQRYGLLTIGDGLVTQIPALVLSTAAGVLVTRVASEEADTPLGEELARQLFGVPKALQVAGGFVRAPRGRPGAAGGAVPGHRRGVAARRTCPRSARATRERQPRPRCSLRRGIARDRTSRCSFPSSCRGASR